MDKCNDLILVLYFPEILLKPKKPNRLLTEGRFSKTSKPSISSTFLKCNAFVTRLLISLRALTMLRLSRAFFLYVLHCKHVHMYSSTVKCTTIFNVLHLYFAISPIRTVIGPVTVMHTALLNVLHLYFAAFLFLQPSNQLL